MLTSNTLLYSLIAVASFAAAQTSTVIRQTKTLFRVGCDSLCSDSEGDLVDVSGVDFADLVSFYLDDIGNSTNSTDGNSTENDAALIYGDIECWDVSEVTDMSGAFAYQDDFNTGIECWNVSSVTDMSSMFFEASSFNQNLNIWGKTVQRQAVVTTDMFTGSGCDIDIDPDTIGRPWCQFDRPLFSPQFECFFFKKCDDLLKPPPSFGSLKGRSRVGMNALN